jgi:hypothetical protein
MTTQNLIKLSPAKLNLLQDCPRCFWLDVVKKIRRPSGPMASIAIKMDSIIKHYFDKYRERNELPPIIRENINGKLPKDMPKTLYHKQDNGITLMGRPDEYLEIKGGFIVPFDHKTKSKPPENTHPTYQLQLDVYSYLLKINGYKTTNKGFLAFYYPCDCDLHEGLDVHCKIIEVITNFSRVRRLIKKAEEILSGDMPENGKDCQFCEWVEKLR